MEYMNVNDASALWQISARSVRNYCASGKVPGARLEGKTWKIPKTAKKPSRKQRSGKIANDLLTRLRQEKDAGMAGGIYHKIQIELAYNSNHIEGSQLSYEQTRHIFETNTIAVAKGTVNVDDVLETVNHFRCVDLIIDMAKYQINESLIKQLHRVLKSSTSDSRKAWFAVGDYKRLENEVGGKMAAMPVEVEGKMKNLLRKYNNGQKKTLRDILQFHYEFESIHPFQDGNGRIGRLIMFKECLKNGITPFIIEDDVKLYYYRGLSEWKSEPGYLTDTCLACQDRFKAYLDYFGIRYDD